MVTQSKQITNSTFFKKCRRYFPMMHQDGFVYIFLLIAKKVRFQQKCSDWFIWHCILSLWIHSKIVISLLVWTSRKRSKQSSRKLWRGRTSQNKETAQIRQNVRALLRVMYELKLLSFQYFLSFSKTWKTFVGLRVLASSLIHLAIFPESFRMHFFRLLLWNRFASVLLKFRQEIYIDVGAD